MFKKSPLNIVPIGKIRDNLEKNQPEIKYTEGSTNYSENEIIIQNLNNQPITNIEKNEKNKNEILTEKPIYNIPIDLIKKDKIKEESNNNSYIVIYEKKEEKKKIDNKTIIYTRKPEFFIPINNILKEKEEREKEERVKENENNKKNKRTKKQQQLNQINNKLSNNINTNLYQNIKINQNNFLNKQNFNLAPNLGMYYTDYIFTQFNNYFNAMSKLNEQKAQFKILKEMALNSMFNPQNKNHYLLKNYINDI